MLPTYAGVKLASHREGKSMARRGKQQTSGTSLRQTGALDHLGWWGRRSVLGMIVMVELLCWGMAPAQAAPFAYITHGDVLNSGSNTVSVVDTATNSVVASVPVGTGAGGVAVHPAGTFVYVANNLSNTVSVLDTVSNIVVASIPVGTGTGPWGVAVHPAGTFLYVANFFSTTVSVIDTTTNAVVDSIPVGTGPCGVAVHPAGTFLYVANFFSNTVSVLDTVSHTLVGTVPVADSVNVAVHPAGSFVYVVDDGPNILSVIDTATNTVTATVRFPFGMDTSPGVVVHPAGTFVYVPNTLQDTVSVVATATNTVVATVPVGTRPWGVAVHPAGTFVYVTNTYTLGAASNDVSVIDTATNSVVATIPMEGVPLEVAVGPQLPGLSLTLNQATFQQGDTLTVTATVYPGEGSRLVDAYVALRLPDQTLWFLQGDGSLTPTVQPLLHNGPVAALRRDLFRYTFGGGEPVGRYTWLAAFTEPGTTQVIGLIAQAAFMFSP